MFGDGFADRTVLVTGHTGFKGSWLSLWLHSMGARVVGYALDPPTDPSNFVASNIEELLHDHIVGDIRDAAAVSNVISKHQPEFIFHLAAQPLVRESYASPRETFEVNAMGTACLLDAVRDSAHSTSVVLVTTDKCYENREHVWGYRESDAMGGHDPYSASKGCAELVASSYRRSFFHPDKLEEHGVSIATARAGNVIGGGDWAKDRIMTDIVAAITGAQPVGVRSPRAVRPWQHVLEPLSGYLALAGKMDTDRKADWCCGWNFGPSEGSTITVAELCSIAIKAWGSGRWDDLSDGDQPHEAHILRLCIDKATTELGWRPCWSVDECISRTVNWYRDMASATSMRQACLADITAYEQCLAT